MNQNRISHFTLLCFASSLLCLTSTTNANIYINNLTNFSMTGSTAYSPCSSSIAGNDGILQPYSTITIPDTALEAYCGIVGCTGYIYTNNHCIGNPVATVELNRSLQIIKINNLDTAHFNIIHDTNHVKVTQMNLSTEL